jgi:hypothetical protein
MLIREFAIGIRNEEFRLAGNIGKLGQQTMDGPSDETTFLSEGRNKDLLTMDVACRRHQFIHSFHLFIERCHDGDVCVCVGMV